MARLAQGGQWNTSEAEFANYTELVEAWKV